MFDPQTAKMFAEGPDLAKLDRDRLADDFTKSYADIIAQRIRLAGNVVNVEETLVALGKFRRLASTYESMVLFEPDGPRRQAAAFVAAQAYHLLHLANRLESDGERGAFRFESISPLVSAMLLFLIAHQPSDAAEIAGLIMQSARTTNYASGILRDGLCALSQGRLSQIGDLLREKETRITEDSLEAATEELYGQLLVGVNLLSTHLLDVTSEMNQSNRALEAFSHVSNLSVERTDFSGDFATAIISNFPGPYILSKLLIRASEVLIECATSKIPPPNGAEVSVWQKSLVSLIKRRPFLWNNHTQALSEGFLAPGVSSVVSFPTGAGKTTISSLKISATIAMGKSVVYLAPTVALVGQMKADLREAFPWIDVRESLLAEDFYAEIGSELQAHVQIVVMTPERCLAMLSASQGAFQGVGLVIFDECHLIHPRDSGRNRRSLDAMLCMIYLFSASPNADWVLLSAMIQNTKEFADWLSSVLHRRCLSLDLNWKPTRQVRGCLVFSTSEINSAWQFLNGRSQVVRRPDSSLPLPSAELKRSIRMVPYGFFSLKQTWQTLEAEDYTLLRLLETTVPLSVGLSKNKQTWYPTPNKNEVASHLAASLA